MYRYPLLGHRDKMGNLALNYWKVPRGFIYPEKIHTQEGDSHKAQFWYVPPNPNPKGKPKL